MSAAPARLILVDPCLDGPGSHPWQYAVAVLGAARRRGWGCDLVCRSTAELPAEACAGCGDLARAERGLRMALDAPGPRDRVFLHGALADVVAKADRVDDAISWLEAVRAERRPPWIWRKLGQLQLRAGRHDLAVQALEAALHRDRHGRHLTLIALGWAHLARGAPGPAKAAFLEALKVRKKRDQIVDDRARTGLREALHARGEPDGDDDINALLGRALADADLPRAAGPGREQARRVAGGRR